MQDSSAYRVLSNHRHSFNQPCIQHELTHPKLPSVSFPLFRSGLFPLVQRFLLSLQPLQEPPDQIQADAKKRKQNTVAVSFMETFEARTGTAIKVIWVRFETFLTTRI